MSAPGGCPELEVLFGALAGGEGPVAQHARTCPACSALVEAHRQLERELFRLADPLPPAALVPGVMARVVAEPPALRHELWTGLSILAVSLVAGLFLFVSSDAALGTAGTSLVSLLGEGAVLLRGVLRGLHALWLTAAAPLAAAVSAFLVACVLALRRLAASASPSSDYSGA